MAGDLRMHAGDQDFLIIGPVENADLPALWHTASGSPKEVVGAFLRAGLLETAHLAALRVDARHQQGVTLIGVEQVVEIAEPVDVFSLLFLILVLRGDQRFETRWPLLEFNLGSGFDAAAFGTIL